MWADPSGLVIEIRGNLLQRMELFAILQTLTSDELSITSHGILRGMPRSSSEFWRVHYTPTNNNDLSSGTALIRELINSQHTVQIRDTGGSSRASTTNATNASTPGVGSGGRIYLNLNHSHYNLVQLATGGTSREYAPLNIVLAHELIHTLHYVQGVRETRTVEHGFRHSNGSIVWREIPVEEIRTIGITSLIRHEGSWINIALPSITENSIRREHGLPVRVSWYTPRP